jgi:hypothetical protein
MTLLQLLLMNDAGLGYRSTHSHSKASEPASGSPYRLSIHSWRDLIQFLLQLQQLPQLIQIRTISAGRFL